MTELKFDIRKFAEATPLLAALTPKPSTEKAAAEGGQTRAGRCETLLGLARQGALTAIVLACASAMVSERGSLATALRGALAKIEQISKVEAMGISLIIDHASTEKTLEALLDAKNASTAFREDVRTAARSIGGGVFARLMQVDAPLKSCIYPQGAPDTLQFVLTDFQLVNQKLARMKSDPTTFADLRKSIARGEKSDNGDPVSCYELELTELGRDVKSLLVTRLTTLFAQPAR